MLDLDYVLPLRWTDDAGFEDLTAYLNWLSTHVDVIVVDGSPVPLYARHARAWQALVRHLPPAADLRFANGKVNGVLTGVRHCTRERIILADDDVRYDLAGLAAIARHLDGADLVRPQNVFAPTPWHARWDTARSLLNRCMAADYPGTFGVRRSTLLATGGYDGDVLFENLELIRTVRAFGGREVRPLDLYVRRAPPTARHFWSQRVRQAYDDLAQPARLITALSVVPAAALALARRRGDLVAAGAAATVAAAEIGRRRAGGREVFPRDAPLYAPLWMIERGICSWLATATRVWRGGVRYGGGRIAVAAHSRRELRRRACSSAARIGSRARTEAPGPVGPVAERLAG
jgi:hypothetical protein